MFLAKIVTLTLSLSTTDAGGVTCDRVASQEGGVAILLITPCSPGIGPGGVDQFIPSYAPDCCKTRQLCQSKALKTLAMSCYAFLSSIFTSYSPKVYKLEAVSVLYVKHDTILPAQETPLGVETDTDGIGVAIDNLRVQCTAHPRLRGVLYPGVRH